MEASLKEHRGRVADIKINSGDTQAVSASYDGSCIIWDLKSHTRIMCLFESTMFKQVVYHPDESQLLTTGSDRKVTYWDCFDGQAIRMLDGSDSGEVNALAITKAGEHFASGGEDKKLKVWDYDEGISYYVGHGHSGNITRVRLFVLNQFRLLFPLIRSSSSVLAKKEPFSYGILQTRSLVPRQTETCRPELTDLSFQLEIINHICVLS
jgi:WD40 repeat protein